MPAQCLVDPDRLGNPHRLSRVTNKFMLELEIATEDAFSRLPFGNGSAKKEAAVQKERLISELCSLGTQAKDWGFRAQTPEIMKFLPYLDAQI